MDRDKVAETFLEGFAEEIGVDDDTLANHWWGKFKATFADSIEVRRVQKQSIWTGRRLGREFLRWYFKEKGNV